MARSEASYSVQLSLFSRSMDGSDVPHEVRLCDQPEVTMAGLLVLSLGIQEQKILMEMRLLRRITMLIRVQPRLGTNTRMLLMAQLRIHLPSRIAVCFASVPQELLVSSSKLSTVWLRIYAFSGVF